MSAHLYRMKGLRGLSLAVAAVAMSVVPNCLAINYQFGGTVDNTFLTPGNWTPVGLPGLADRAFINDNHTVTYGTNDATTVDGLTIGADYPVTGELGTAGTLNMSAGSLIVNGGGNSFQIGRAAYAGDGIMKMTGNAYLEIRGSDPVIGTRDNGVLDIGDNASVASIRNGGDPTVYWRVGNYGPTIDAGLEGNGLLNVHDFGSFKAHVVFLGATDSTGELRVADHGSVILTGNLVPRPDGFFAGGSATVRMIGSTATLQAYNLESASDPGEIRTKYRFDADAGGVSPIKLTDAINITNNDLEVNLNGLVVPNLGTVLLFDGDQALVGSRIFGSFTNLTVDGVLNPTNFAVVYDQPNGNILLQAVPEPTTLSALACAGALLIRRRRA